MVKTVEASSPELRSLVADTQAGDEILITVNGKVAGRLTATENGSANAPAVKVVDWAARARELEAHLDDGVIGHSGPDIQTIIDELREERL